ncbi:hypothetical protein KCU59_g105, partial [Aureobasidium melanogenum]
MAPSREKAQTQRDAAVVHPIPQIRPSTIRGRSRPMAPPGEPTAVAIMVGTGCPDARAASVLRSGITNRRGSKNIRPATRLRMMVATIALGT